MDYETEPVTTTPAHSRPAAGARRQRRDTVRAQWIGARARNALRRPMRIGAIAAPIFIGSLVLLVLVPRETRQAQATTTSPAPSPARLVPADTVPYLDAERKTRAELATADSVLADRRARNARRTAAAMSGNALPPAVAAHRDSLNNVLTELSRLIDRAENAPLPASYRALGEAPQLQGDPHVKVLLDSLADIDREREDLGAVGGVDPLFVALTSRANAIGRAIQGIAEQRRTAIRNELAPLTPTAPPPTIAVAVIDTTAAAARRDSAQLAAVAATQALAAARTRNAEIERQLVAAREQANVNVPPLAMLTAALILGTALGFLAVFAGEMRQPRVGNPREVERITWSRVLATACPRPIPAERSRRKADLRLPALLDPTADAYQLLTSSVLVASAESQVITLTGDNEAVTAVIASNLAAVTANDLRSTLLVDLDFSTSSAVALLRVPPSPGVADVLDGVADWAEVIQQAVVGRDRTLDVIATGITLRAAPMGAEAETLASGIGRLARRYDLTLVVAPSSFAPSILPGSDTIVCASVNRTLVDDLLKTVTRLREAGARIMGIVLWDAEEPQLPPAVVPPPPPPPSPYRPRSARPEPSMAGA